jgi:hypothetical protein
VRKRCWGEGVTRKISRVGVTLTLFNGARAIYYIIHLISTPQSVTCFYTFRRDRPWRYQTKKIVYDNKKAHTMPLQASFFPPCNVDEWSKHLMTRHRFVCICCASYPYQPLLFFFHVVNEAFTLFIVVLDAFRSLHLLH